MLSVTFTNDQHIWGPESLRAWDCPPGAVLINGMRACWGSIILGFNPITFVHCSVTLGLIGAVLIGTASLSLRTTVMPMMPSMSWTVKSCVESGSWWSTPGVRAGTGTAMEGVIMVVEGVVVEEEAAAAAAVEEEEEDAVSSALSTCVNISVNQISLRGYYDYLT